MVGMQFISQFILDLCCNLSDCVCVCMYIAHSINLFYIAFEFLTSKISVGFLILFQNDYIQKFCSVVNLLIGVICIDMLI